MVTCISIQDSLLVTEVGTHFDKQEQGATAITAQIPSSQPHS